jgi:hypothetical protein
MDQRLKLSIGAWEAEPPTEPSKPQIQSEGPVEGNVKAQASAMADDATTLASESLAEIYQVLRRHEETPRDLAVEMRLLYQNLPEIERQRLEALRERTTREVGDLFASRIRLLEENISQTQRTVLTQASNRTADVVNHVLGDDAETHNPDNPDNGYDEQELTGILGAGRGGGGRPAGPAPDPGPSPVPTLAPRPAPPLVPTAPAPAPAPGPGGGANLTPVVVRVQHAIDVDCLETIRNNSVSYDTSIVSLAPIAAATPKIITLLGQKIGKTTVLIRYTNGKFAELSVSVTD